jgi:hypothetical protein
MTNISTTFLEFAWYSLTEQQQFRINVKYELAEALKVNTGCKRDVYRAIADKHGYTMRVIENIATKLTDKDIVDE